MTNRTPRASQCPRVPVSAVPRQVQSTPSGLVACSVVIRSVASGSSSGCTEAHRCHCAPSCRITGSFTAVGRAAGQHGAGRRRREPRDGVRLQQVHPPVLGARGGAADVEPPPPVRGVHQRGPLQRLRAEGLLAELGHRGEVRRRRPSGRRRWRCRAPRRPAGAAGTPATRCRRPAGPTALPPRRRAAGRPGRAPPRRRPRTGPPPAARAGSYGRCWTRGGSGLGRGGRRPVCPSAGERTGAPAPR